MNLISTPYLKRHCLKFLNATYRILRILVCTRTGRKIKEILPGQGESTNILPASLSKILSGYSDSMIGDRTVFLKVFFMKSHWKREEECISLRYAARFVDGSFGIVKLILTPEINHRTIPFLLAGAI